MTKVQSDMNVKSRTNNSVFYTSDDLHSYSLVYNGTSLHEPRSQYLVVLQPLWKSQTKYCFKTSSMNVQEKKGYCTIWYRSQWLLQPFSLSSVVQALWYTVRPLFNAVTRLAALICNLNNTLNFMIQNIHRYENLKLILLMTVLEVL